VARYCRRLIISKVADNWNELRLQTDVDGPWSISTADQIS